MVTPTTLHAACCWVALLVFGCPVLAVSQSLPELLERHAYGAVIDRAEPMVAPGDPLTQTALGLAHLRRGEALHRLGHLHARLGEAYAALRGGLDQDPTRFEAEAAQAYAHAATCSQPGSHACSPAWWMEAACASPGAPAAARCRLGQGLDAPTWNVAHRAQQDLLDIDAPDASHRVRGGFALRFFDPASLLSLAEADFVRAAALLAGVDDQRAQLLAGIAAYHGGRDDLANTLLAPLTDPERFVYLGGLAYRAGRPQEAHVLWNRYLGGRAESASAAHAAWARVASAFEPLHDDVRDAYARLHYGSAPPAPTVLDWAAALVDAGGPEEALRVLHSARGYGSAIDPDAPRTDPRRLVLEADVSLALGRSFYPNLLNLLTLLHRRYPVAYGALYLAQAFTQPQALQGTSRTGG